MVAIDAEELEALIEVPAAPLEPEAAPLDALLLLCMIRSDPTLPANVAVPPTLPPVVAVLILLLLLLFEEAEFDPVFDDPSMMVLEPGPILDDNDELDIATTEPPPPPLPPPLLLAPLLEAFLRIDATSTIRCMA